MKFEKEEMVSCVLPQHGTKLVVVRLTGWGSPWGNALEYPGTMCVYEVLKAAFI